MIGDVADDSAWQIGPAWMNGDLELARGKELIRTYEDVMLKLDAKEQRDLAEEQHPSLPDLVNGGRKDNNSELDSDVLQFSTRSLDEVSMFQIIDFRRPHVAADLDLFYMPMIYVFLHLMFSPVGPSYLKIARHISELEPWTRKVSTVATVPKLESHGKNRW